MDRTSLWQMPYLASAQRSRVRKLQYISDLERVVNVFQTQELDLSAEVAFLNQQHLMLAAENKVLKRRIAVLAQERFMKDSQHKSLKIEFQRLKLLYQHQQQRKSPLLLHYVPACADFDLQLLEFDKFSLGNARHNGTYGRDGRSRMLKNNLPSHCMEDDWSSTFGFPGLEYVGPWSGTQVQLCGVTSELT
eukprot:Gb_28107 [translate_table: standard]